MAGKNSLRIRDLKGLGPRSEEMLAEIGVRTVDQFLAIDPYLLYARLKPLVPGLNILALYALIGAQEDRHWLEVKREQRGEILLRLDMMGLGSTKSPRKQTDKAG